MDLTKKGHLNSLCFCVWLTLFCVVVTDMWSVFACCIGEEIKKRGFIRENKNEVPVGDGWSCEWTWERSHCKQYWSTPSGLWLSGYFYQDWYCFLSPAPPFDFNFFTLFIEEMEWNAMRMVLGVAFVV